MEQKGHAHQADDQKLLEQLAPQIVHRAPNERGAVIHRDDLHPVRQTGCQLSQARLHLLYGLLRIFTIAHDYDAPDHFTFAIEFGDTAAHLRSQRNIRDILQAQRCAVGIEPERDIGEIIQALYVTCRPHHILRFGHFHHRGTYFLVAALDRGLHQ